MDYKYHFKVILVGNAGVGKTAMVRRFTKGFFPFQEAPTIGVDMNVKTVDIDGEKVKVCLCHNLVKMTSSTAQNFFR